MARQLPKRMYVGMDPGADGGMFLVDEKGALIRFDRINELESIIDFFKNTKRIAEHKNLYVTCVFEEYKGDGAANATRHSGMYVGIAMTLCSLFDFRLVRVAPQTWKAHHKIIVHQKKGEPKLSDTERYKASKERSMDKFRELYADVNIIFPRCRKEHEGVAEAGLIAAYGHALGL